MSEPLDCNPAVAAAAAGWRLPTALAVSVLLHGLAVFGGQTLGALSKRPEARLPEPLQASLRPAPRPAPTLVAPEIAEPAATPPKIAPPSPRPAPRKPSTGTQADLATLASRQIASRLLYPEEAIARGLEGQAAVMLFLDAAGNAVAARLEKSSGHAILDDAAVAAARQVRALPEGEAREVLLPVRFRLN